MKSSKSMPNHRQQADLPVHPGQIVPVVITGYGHEGEGVGRYRDFTIFVSGAVQGETIQVKIDEVKKNYARGTVTGVVQPAAERIAPLCPVAQECGGCQLQHLSYPAQLTMKRQRVVDALERIGGLAGVKVHPVLGMAEPWHYRNKVQYPVGRTEQGGVMMGFYRQGTHKIVPFSECLLQPEGMNRILTGLQDLCRRYSFSVYDETTGRGLLRHILIRKGFHSGALMIVFVTNGTDFPGHQALLGELTAAFPQIEAVVQNINTRRGNVILGADTRVLFGKDTIRDILDGLEFSISARSFFQVNPLQTEVLYNQAVTYAGLSGDQTVVDAYCGVGSLTLFLARRAREVYGIEVVPEAIRDAKANAAANGITNTHFFVGEVEKVLPRLVLEEGIRFDAAVVDPPRSGCERSVLESFAANGVKRIVYVSCNPSTLARDLKILTELGYETVEIQPVDMFPQTYHVETVCKIIKRIND